MQQKNINTLVLAGVHPKERNRSSLVSGMTQPSMEKIHLPQKKKQRSSRQILNITRNIVIRVKMQLLKAWQSLRNKSMNTIPGLADCLTQIKNQTGNSRKTFINISTGLHINLTFETAPKNPKIQPSQATLNSEYCLLRRMNPEMLLKHLEHIES